MLAELGTGPEAVFEELERRFSHSGGVEEKASRGQSS
jgi:hypothetical protein